MELILWEHLVGKCILYNVRVNVDYPNTTSEAKVPRRSKISY